jgi:predicted O-linked N-acetylglucosamine transferase (SPINDLY family)
VTFGSFNNITKLTHEMIGVWADVLNAVPGSRLILKAHGLAIGEARLRVQHAFAVAGLDSARLELRAWTSRVEDSLAAYGEFDIALDTSPYNGTTTTFEALCMGVPVVTLRTDRHAGRVGASILTHLGRPEWIANDPDGYVAAVTRLAADLPRLADERARLRDTLRTSVLCDGVSFARKLERVFARLVEARSGRVVD